MRYHPTLLIFLLLASIGVTAGPMALAGMRDHETARQALAAGEIMPLAALLEKIRHDHPGDVIETELERKRWNGQERWVYELKILSPQGAVSELYLDARQGDVLQIKAAHDRKRGR